MIPPRVTHYLAASLLAAILTAPSVRAEAILPDDLAEKWAFYGVGSRAAQNQMFYMEESEGSSGVMIVSPKAFSGDLTLRYEIMPMSAASVCVAMLFASDHGEPDTLTIPEGYDGSMGLWMDAVENYFFAFHNAAHDRTPFAVKFPSKTELGKAEKNVMRSGEFYTIEIGRRGNLVWFSVNGERLFEGEDADPLPSGRIALRIRGIPQQAASCLIRNLTIKAVGE